MKVLVFCLIYVACSNIISDATAAIDNADRANVLATISQTLTVHTDKYGVISQTHPRKQDIEQINYKLPLVSANFKGNLFTAVLNGEDSFFNARQSVREMCGSNLSYLKAYKQLTNGLASTKHSLISEVRRKTVEKIQEANEHINTMANYLDDASNACNNLLNSLNEENSTEFANLVKLFGNIKQNITDSKKSVDELHSVSESNLMAIKSSSIPEDGIIGVTSIDDLIFQCNRTLPNLV